MPEQPREPVMHVVCMDCKVVITQGDDEVHASHGLCERCFVKRIAEIDRKQGAA